MTQEEFDKKYNTCDYCDGSGIDQMLYQDYTPTEHDECPYCDGSGKK